MRFVAFTDIHLHKFPASRILEDGRNELFVAGLGIIDQVYAYCKENEIYNIFFLGDLFFHRNQIDTDVYCNEVYNKFKTKQEDSGNTNLTLIPGNHDQLDRKGSHCLSPFEGIKNVYVIDKNSVFFPHSKSPRRIFCCPYTDNLFSLYEFLKQSTNEDVVLCHQLVLNSPALSGQLFKSGEAVDVHRFRFKALLAGHNHRPFFNSENGVYNIGAPMHHDYGDANFPDRYFIDYDDSREDLVKFIPTKFPIFSTSDDEINGIKPTYVRKKIREVEETKAEARIDLSESDGTNNILSTYISYKQPNINSKVLLTCGLKLLGDDDANKL